VTDRPFAGRSVAVTGASGFVGGAVAAALLAQGAQVRALVRSDAAGRTAAALGAAPVRGDLEDHDALRDLMHGCDLVVHVAGVNAGCIRDPAPMYRVNVRGPAAVIEAAAAAGVARVVHTSSAAAVAEPPGSIGREDTEPTGRFATHYARSKYLGERAAFEAGRRTGVEVVCVGPSSVQGPGRIGGTAKLLLRVARADTAVLTRTWLSVVDVADCAAGHLLAARHGLAGERYLLSGASLSTEEALSLLRRVTGRPRRVVWIPRAVVRAVAPLTALAALVGSTDPPLCPGMVHTLLHGHRYDGSRATRDLGLIYTPAEQTLRRAIAWYAARGMLGGAGPA